MDTESTILKVIRDKVGCNGLRNFVDLGKMRQDTLERRLNAAGRRLNRGNMASVYVMWLRDQITRIGGAERTQVVTAFSRFLYSWDLSLDRSLEVWDDCVSYTLKMLRAWENREGVMEKMETVRNEIIQGYPSSKSGVARAKSTHAVSRPKSIDSLRPASNPRSSQPRLQENIEPPKLPSASTYQPSRRASPMVIDLTNEPEPAPSSLKIVVKLPPNNPAMPSMVPNNYICKRCGIKGKNSSSQSITNSS